MKLRNIFIDFAGSLVIILGLILISPQKVDASVSHITPVSMRGTWYGEGGGYSQKVRITKHSVTWSSGSDHVKMAGWHLSVFKTKMGHHTAVTFQITGEADSTDFYWLGKARVAGEYHRCLVQDGHVAMFHGMAAKHYYIPKYYR